MAGIGSQTPNWREALAAVDSISHNATYVTSTNGRLDVNASATISGSAIPISGATTAIVTAIVDSSGNQISTFGGGTQYTDAGTPPAHPVGTMPIFNNAGTWSQVSNSAGLPVNIVGGSSSGTQYTQGGATVANPTGNAEIWFDGSGNPKAVTPSQPLPSNLTDGTNTANVKAGSTLPQQSDKALVTTLSPNNTGLPVNLPNIVQAVNAVSSGSVSSINATFSSNNSIGNTLVVVCAVGNTNTPTISDTNSTTYKSAVGGSGSGCAIRIFFAPVAVSGANTVTITNTGTAASMAVEIYEVNGLVMPNSARQPDVSDGNVGTGTSFSSTVATNYANEIAFLGIAVGTGTATITVPTGFNNDSGQVNPATPAGLFSFSSSSFVQSDIAGVTNSVTLGTSRPWLYEIAYFRPVSINVAIAAQGKLNNTAPGSAMLMGVVNSSSNLNQVSSAGFISSDGNAGAGTVSVSSLTYNGSTYDRVRSATSASNTTGTGLLGAAALGFDGTNYQRITVNSTTTTSKFGADANILSILGTAPTTAGKLDIKGADGDVFVRQTTASNLNMTAFGYDGATQRALSTTTGGILITENGATAAAVPTAATYQAGNAATALPAAATVGNLTGAMYDKFGRQVVLPNAQRDLVLPMTQLTLTATTTETSLIGAVASTFNDILSLVVINTSATATQVDFRDSTAGTIRLSLYVPAGDTRGISLTTPMPQAAVNTAWTAKCGTSVSSVIITGTYISNK